MPEVHPVEKLATLSRLFDRDATDAKKVLLREVASNRRLPRKHLLRLQDTLNFMRAYPDDRETLTAVESVIARMRDQVELYTKGDGQDSRVLNSGLPATSNTYPYSYRVLQNLVRLDPGLLEFDWDGIPDETAIMDALAFTAVPSEWQGLDDIRVDAKDWLECSGAGPSRTCLEVALSLFAAASMDERQQEHVFEQGELPVIYPLSNPGSARSEIGVPPGRVHYQRGPVSRERFPLPSAIRRPIRSSNRVSRKRGQALIDLSLRALCSRNLEIYPLIYANPDDATVVDGSRGLQVVLLGVVPEFRNTLESLFFFLILKNGVPMAYGPASVYLGCCEMGINLFPEFRGSEIRYVYAELMRSLYHLASVRYFYLAAYGMGMHNLEALKTGAFWFYRKLGFSASNSEVEELAREEEAIMQRQPGYRSSMATLRKLSDTTAYLDLSEGQCRPLRFSGVGLEVTRSIAQTAGGDRAKATKLGARRLARVLSMPAPRLLSAPERHALATIAPVLNLIDDLEQWSAGEKRGLASIIRAKGAAREYEYLKRSLGHPRLASALHEIAWRGVLD